jgi:hypothetical protein
VASEGEKIKQEQQFLTGWADGGVTSYSSLEKAPVEVGTEKMKFEVGFWNTFFFKSVG